MPSILGVPYAPRGVLLGLVFAALATTAFIAFAGLYRAMFPLLMGWVVVFVVAARLLVDEDEEREEDALPEGARGGDAGGEAADEDEADGS